MILIFLRKIRSFYLRSVCFLSTLHCYLSAFGNPAISIESGCSFGRGVSLRATDGGSIALGRCAITAFLALVMIVLPLK